MQTTKLGYGCLMVLWRLNVMNNESLAILLLSWLPVSRSVIEIQIIQILKPPGNIMAHFMSYCPNRENCCHSQRLIIIMVSLWHTLLAMMWGNKPYSWYNVLVSHQLHKIYWLKMALDKFYAVVINQYCCYNSRVIVIHYLGHDMCMD